MRDLVSVVIPTHNIERYIRQTLDSILAQTHGRLEVIVVDDGSTDATRSIVRTYGQAVTLIEQENSGVCVARNLGFSRSHGAFVCFCDHDDYWFPDKFEKQMAAMNADPQLGIVYSEFSRWSPTEDGVFPSPDFFEEAHSVDGIDAEKSGWQYHQLLIDCWVLTSSALIRRTVLEKCGCFDVALPYSEDWDLWLRASREFRFLKLRSSLVLYRQHALQGSRVNRPVDYRAKLLTEAVARWGYSGPGGVAIPRSVFARNLARYRISFALGHLRDGDAVVGREACWAAWKLSPFAWKPLALIAASFAGWRPN